MVLDSFSLKGRVALVTGGGTGIGYGIATGLAEAGADIACVYGQHAPDELMEYVRSLGGRALPIRADLLQKESVPYVMEQTLTHFGRLDILVNNAGICPRASALDYSEEIWDEVIQLNQKTVFMLSQLAAKQFIKQNSRGKIINIASMLSFLASTPRRIPPASTPSWA